MMQGDQQTVIPERVAPSAAASITGPVGPLAFSALLFLLVAAPLMRGGNRQVALIVLETAALAFLVALSFRVPLRAIRPAPRQWLLAFVCLSPAWLALIYLLPIPVGLWSTVPGRPEYLELLQAAEMPPTGGIPLSLVPAATKSSLLVGIPLLAVFAAGMLCSIRQLRVIFLVVVAMAILQTLLGMLQMAGGSNSPLFVGAAPGRPLGTFANPNHFANYVAMGLAAFIWLAWLATSDRPASRPRSWHDAAVARRMRIVRIATAVLLVVGILMSRSRGATLSGLAAAVVAFFLIISVGGSTHSWKKLLLWSLGALFAAVALVGAEALMGRFDVYKMVADAPSRTMQVSTTLEGAWHFWPFGSGWGTYGAIYPRYQPVALVGTAEYAHQDYAQMLFEGGVFAVVLMAAVGLLLIGRAVTLVRAGVRRRRLRTEEMAAAICGLGLLGFLLHSLVEFNMHIPANAILAALLAGAYLRPLDPAKSTEEA